MSLTTAFIPTYIPEMYAIEQVLERYPNANRQKRGINTLAKVMNLLCAVIKSLPASIVQRIADRQWLYLRFRRNRI